MAITVNRKRNTFNRIEWTIDGPYSHKKVIFGRQRILHPFSLHYAMLYLVEFKTISSQDSEKFYGDLVLHAEFCLK
jgi:hypothetical protein